jgi:hypothetical protein
MKNKEKILACIAMLALMMNCHNNTVDQTCFNGEIRWIDDIRHVTKVILSEVSLDGAYYGWPAVYDSLMIFRNSKLPGAHFNIFNLNTGNEIGDFCNKGGGPEEMISIHPIYQFFKEGEELKTLLFAANESKLYVWNITKSVDQRTTVLDTVIPYAWREEHNMAYYKYIYRLNRDTLLAYVQSAVLTIDAKEATVPCYQQRTVRTNELIRNYDIFKRPVRNNDAVIMPETFFYSSDGIKPDGSRIVQGMWNLSQINIIDTRTGRVTGYRMKNTPDVSVFKTDMENSKVYYTRLQADDHYIYALYCGKQRPLSWAEEVNAPLLWHIIHVFDWEGNLIRKLDLDHPVYEFWLDQVKNRLYTLDMGTDKVYSYDLNELNLK